MEIIQIDPDTARVMAMLRENIRDKRANIASVDKQKSLYKMFMSQIMETREAA